MTFIHESNRIYAMQDNEIVAEVTFPEVAENIVIIDHTYVSDTLRGQGIAGKLMEEAVKNLKAGNKKAKLSCSYAVLWFQKHPEYKNLLA